MTNSNENKQVLVTGGSGFVGVYCILQLLQSGYHVKTTIRSLKRKPDVLAMLSNGGVEAGEKLSFFAADLTSDDGWNDAVADCDYVLHVASPFPAMMPKNEDDLIIPAKEGTLRVLRAARDAGVKRVVITSSFAAIGYGHESTNETFTEKMWTNLNNKNLSAYIKSKTIAEKAAWEFIENEGGNLELAVINPTGIFGPLLSSELSSSVQMLKQFLDGAIKAVPQTYFNVVDVRDVADLHIRAMIKPEAKGERFLALAGKCLSLHDAAMILRNNLGDKAKNVPTKVLPNWVVRVAALFKYPICRYR